MTRPPVIPSDAPLKDRLLNYIQRTDYVSFAELRNHFAEAREDGDCGLTLPGRPNSVMWRGMSDAYCDALASLLKAGEIHPQTSCLMVYMVDGGMLTLPLGKRIGKTDFKKPHWIPVTLRCTEAVREHPAPVKEI